MDDHKEQFERLERFANESIERAKLNRSNPLLQNQPINWAAVQVGYMEFWVDNFGCSGYRVIIDEASPSCHGLEEYLAKQIFEQGFEYEIHVRCEWSEDHPDVPIRSAS